MISKSWQDFTNAEEAKHMQSGQQDLVMSSHMQSGVLMIAAGFPYAMCASMQKHRTKYSVQTACVQC